MDRRLVQSQLRHNQVVPSWAPHFTSLDLGLSCCKISGKSSLSSSTLNPENPKRMTAGTYKTIQLMSRGTQYRKVGRAINTQVY